MLAGALAASELRSHNTSPVWKSIIIAAGDVMFVGAVVVVVANAVVPKKGTDIIKANNIANNFIKLNAPSENKIF